MSRLPRLAVGTIQPEADPQAVLWALMETFRRAGLQVQSFLSRSHFPRYSGTAAVTGMNVRHLDSWLMSPEVCRDLFRRAACAADLALVEGQFPSATEIGHRGGRLEPLCQWLDLPRLIVIDSSQIGPCGLPQRPRLGDGLLLDRVASRRHFAHLSTELEALWGMPVVGALEELPALRHKLKRIPTGGSVPPDVCSALGDHFAGVAQLDRIWDLATRRGLPDRPALCRFLQLAPRLTVAIAFDEAFHRYFPDTLDSLELRGATIVDFSPLRDESIPEGTDLVYLGCGSPERFARDLSENHCMTASLRNHVRLGGRIYAEGGGAAYLCQQMETRRGDLRHMVGILPAIARFTGAQAPPIPVELTLSEPSWLGLPGTTIRGYRNSHWQLESTCPSAGLVAEANCHNELVGSLSTVGSLLHLNFAAQPHCLRHFFYPYRCRRGRMDPWAGIAESVQE